MTLTGSGGPWATQLRLRDTLATTDMCWGSTEKWGRPKKEPAELGSPLFQHYKDNILIIVAVAVNQRGGGELTLQLNASLVRQSLVALW